MITLPELLEDKAFRKFFERQPSIPVVKRTTPPYRIWVQKEPRGRWAKKDVGSYQSAVRWFDKNLELIYDGALAIPSTQTAPPKRLVRVSKDGKPVLVRNADGTKTQKIKEVLWVPRIPADERKHLWCPYCRRPTVFAWFSKHHNQPKVLQPEYSRCTICGLREESLPRSYR